MSDSSAEVRPVKLRLLAGADLTELIDVASRRLAPGSRIVIAAADPQLATTDASFGRVIARTLARCGHASRLLVPPRSTAAAWLRAPRRDWREIDVSTRAGHPFSVSLPGALDAGDPVVAVNDLTVKRDAFSPVAIGIWARFAHPRDRTAALFRDQPEMATAEIALAVSPILVLLRGVWDGGDLIVAATDQIAAELAGRALLDHRDLAWNPEPVGPWEDPLVQRATELELGVRIPVEIHAERCWLGAHDAPDREAFLAFSANLLARIGVLVRG